MSETFTHKAKLDSVAIRGWLVLIVPFVSTILRMSGVQMPEDFENDFIANTMQIVEGIVYLVGLVLVWKGRHEAVKPLKGGLFSGWKR